MNNNFNNFANLDYQVVHTSPGRIRLVVSRLKNDLKCATKLQELLSSLHFVVRVRINLAASSIAIRYEASGLSNQAIQEYIASCIQQAVTQESHTDRGLELVRVPGAIAPTNIGVTVEYPDRGIPKAYLKLRELAKRLGQSSKTIAVQRLQPDFSEWSRARDPEGTGWIYDRSARRFYEVAEQVKTLVSPSSTHTEKVAHTEEEFAGKLGGEIVGEAIGTAVGEIFLGAIGALVASEVMGKVGGLIGESINKQIADVVGLVDHVGGQIATEELLQHSDKIDRLHHS